MTIHKTMNKRWKSLCIILFVILLLAALSTAYLFFFHRIIPGRILPNVSVAGVQIGGLTKEEAISVIRKASASSYEKTDMQICAFEKTLSLTPQQTGAVLDAQGIVDTAYSFGRSGSLQLRLAHRFQSRELGFSMDALDYLVIDTDVIANAIQTFASQFSGTLTQHSYQLLGEIPDLHGETPDPSALELLIIMGTPGYDFDTEILFNMVLNAYRQRTFRVEYTCPVQEPELLDLDGIYAECTSEPVDAVMDLESFSVSQHKYGLQFDLDDARKQIASAEPGAQIRISFYTVAPEHTYQSVSSVLYRDILGSYTARSSSNPNRDVNLRLACEAVDGVVLYPGEVFAYNPTLGERTEEAGYKEADSYWGNETVQTFGGGICQVSSAIYYCAMTADLEIVERHNHGFISSYVPFGMDAAVDWSGPDFKFRNTLTYPIRIEAEADGGIVKVSLIGTDTKDYYIKMEYEVLSVTPYETVEVTLPLSNENGYRDGDVIVSPYTGYKIKTYRCKYSKDNDTLLSRELEVTSNYAKRDAQICKIVSTISSGN